MCSRVMEQVVGCIVGLEWEGMVMGLLGLWDKVGGVVGKWCWSGGVIYGVEWGGRIYGVGLGGRIYGTGWELVEILYRMVKV